MSETIMVINLTNDEVEGLIQEFIIDFDYEKAVENIPALVEKVKKDIEKEETES